MIKGGWTMWTVGRSVIGIFYSVIFPKLMRGFSGLVPAYCFENWEYLSGAYRQAAGKYWNSVGL
jgi:hypothetical protein